MTFTPNSRARPTRGIDLGLCEVLAHSPLNWHVPSAITDTSSPVLPKPR
jgi:hypothetical protein